MKRWSLAAAALEAKTHAFLLVVEDGVELVEEDVLVGLVLQVAPVQPVLLLALPVTGPGCPGATAMRGRDL